MRFRKMNDTVGYIMSMIHYCVKRSAIHMNNMIHRHADAAKKTVYEDIP